MVSKSRMPTKVTATYPFVEPVVFGDEALSERNISKKNIVEIAIILVVLLSEVVTLFLLKPHYLLFNSVLSVIFLFVSGLMLFDFTYRRKLKTMFGIFIYGFTSVISLVFAEAITILYTSYLYPDSFSHHTYSNSDALADALILISGYGYPKATEKAHAIIIFLMLYSWLVNVLLISKLIALLRQKIT